MKHMCHSRLPWVGFLSFLRSRDHASNLVVFAMCFQVPDLFVVKYRVYRAYFVYFKPRGHTVRKPLASPLCKQGTCRLWVFTVCLGLCNCVIFLWSVAVRTLNIWRYLWINQYVTDNMHLDRWPDAVLDLGELEGCISSILVSTL